jgi:S-adenosylmethionine/arginine decarboxylase-like enzyme
MGFPDLPLGERMHVLGMVLRGELDENRWLCFLHTMCEAVGMKQAGAPSVWTYPMHGKGGNGKTIVLPITDSFLALDTWPDHDGAYLFICSCRAFDPFTVDRVASEFDLAAEHDQNRRFYSELHLT